MHIRPATEEDCDAIAAIWNPIIRDSQATFNSQPKTPAAIMADIQAKHTDGAAFLVAVQGADFLGFATYGQFRPSNGYRHTMEHTVILAPQSQRRGIGQKLMTQIEDHARNQGHHAMIAAISDTNSAAIAFHAGLGYNKAGHLPQVGRKFDCWFDLVLMQKIL
ncbi:MAG TPA: GNAT family N-acetyltransferase [Rhodobacteraceae bacterium]|jgi:L-amino acid N-acyltransferase|nr:N-acetyltransferase family protein [Rhodobacter sp.]HBN32355.1 GNAT family N-acetyltransferase [Paracoccaceae bacterium]